MSAGPGVRYLGVSYKSISVNLYKAKHLQNVFDDDEKRQWAVLNYEHEYESRNWVEGRHSGCDCEWSPVVVLPVKMLLSYCLLNIGITLGGSVTSGTSAAYEASIGANWERAQWQAEM